MGRNTDNSTNLTDDEAKYLKLLGRTLLEGPFAVDDDGRRLITTNAVKSGVFTLFYHDSYRGVKSGFEEYMVKCADSASLHYDTMLKTLREVTDLLEADGVETVLLKGPALSEFYPKPELRQFSDIDLYLKERNLAARSVRVLTERGYDYLSEKEHPHHLSFRSPNGVLIELHTDVIRPLNPRKDGIIRELFKEACSYTVPANIGNSVYEVFDKPLFALHVLLHSLEHYMGAGMGMKLICDNLVMLNALDDEGLEEYLYYIDALGIRGFLVTIVQCAYRYMDLDSNKTLKITGGKKGKCDECISAQFIKECLQAGRFGETSRARVVGNESPGLCGMIRQVDRASYENWPNAYRMAVIRPILWVMAIVRFIGNNKKLRGVKTSEVIKNARERGKIVKSMNLWE